MSDKNTEKREQVTMFVPPAMKKRLAASARANYRTISSEASFRIAESYEREDNAAKEIGGQS